MDFSKFNQFLKSEEVYHQAQRHWQSTVEQVAAGEATEAWMDNRYANGQEILDGNPIYSVFFPRKSLAIRIIQLDKTVENPIMVVWVDTVEHAPQQVQELVVSLQLFAYTFQDALAVLTLFKAGKLTQTRMDALNKRYERKWEQKKLSYVANNRLLESMANKMAAIVQGYSISRWDEALADINTLRVSFKKNVAKSLPDDLHFNNSQVSAKFDKLKSSLAQLSDVITLGHTLDSGQLIKKYSTLIIRRYESPSNYVRQVKTKSDNVNESLRRLKEVSSRNNQ